MLNILMKISTIIAGILVLAGCAGVGYNFLSTSSKRELSAPVTETSKIPLPVPVAPAAPKPPPPAPSAAPAPVTRERLTAPNAGSAPGNYAPPRDMGRLYFSGPPSRPSNEPTGGSRPPLKVIEGTKIDDISVQTFNANMAFSMRESANIDEDIKAQLLIDPSKDLEQLEKELTVKGNKFSKNIKISKIVKATITAPDFDVKNITEEEQFITLDKPTEWLWTLSPKATGTYEVNLSVTAILNINGRESKHHIKTFDRTVTVEITRQQIISKWWGENWKWVTSTIVIPLLIFLLKDWALGLLKRKKKS